MPFSISWWDVVIVLFIALAIWRGYRKGFALRVGGWVGGILAFFVIWHKLPAIDAASAQYVNGRAQVAALIRNYLGNRQGTEAVDVSALREFIQQMPMPSNISGQLLAELNKNSAQITSVIYDNVSQILAVPLWHAILFAGAWAVAMVVLYFSGHLLHRLITRVPLIETLDRFVGAFFSALLSLVLIGSVSIVLHFFTTPTGTFGKALHESFFIPFVSSVVKFLLSGPSVFFGG